MTFFSQIKKGEILRKDIKFDLIFIDGLHLEEQATKDIHNSIDFLSENGYILLHDCNPPTKWHAREKYYDKSTPAGPHWNGSTWKAFVKFRKINNYYSCCIDTDWGGLELFTDISILAPK